MSLSDPHLSFLRSPVHVAHTDTRISRDLQVSFTITRAFPQRGGVTYLNLRVPVVVTWSSVSDLGHRLYLLTTLRAGPCIATTDETLSSDFSSKTVRPPTWIGMPSQTHPQAQFVPISPEFDLAALVENAPNFEYVTRVSTEQLKEHSIQSFEALVLAVVIQSGKPLIIEDWQTALPNDIFSK